jgi:cob(I)alamin adenosyltransferase
MRMPATALAVLGLLAGCGQPQTTPTPLPAPATAVARYFADLAAHDCQAAFALLADPLRTRVGGEDQFCIDSAASPNRSTAVDATRMTSAASAVVTVTVVKVDGSRRQDDITAILAGGTWKLSDITARNATGGTLFDIDAANTQIRAEYLQKTGRVLVTLTCDQHGSISVVAGQQLACAFVDAARTAGTLTITVGADGAYTWATSNATRLAIPSPT